MSLHQKNVKDINYKGYCVNCRKYNNVSNKKEKMSLAKPLKVKANDTIYL